MQTDTNLEAILAFLETEREEPSLDFLRRLILAYRDRVPFETATRLLRFRDFEKPEDRVRLPAEFWREKMTLGAGGSCSDSTYAFKKLLDDLGFCASLAINSEGEVKRDANGKVLDFPRGYSHCSVIVSFGADRFVADPCCATYIKTPLPLDNPERVEVKNEKKRELPYHYAVAPLGEVDGECFYELFDLGGGGGRQMYVLRDRDFSDAEFEEHMRDGYRNGYSPGHLSILCRDKRSKVEYRYGSGRLWWSTERMWIEAPKRADHIKTISKPSNIPVEILREAANYLEGRSMKDGPPSFNGGSPLRASRQ